MAAQDHARDRHKQLKIATGGHVVQRVQSARRAHPRITPDRPATCLLELVVAALGS